MDHVGEVAALHSGADDVLQGLVGNQLHLDAGLGGKGVADLFPHAGVGLFIGGGQSGHLDGTLGGLGGAGAALAAGIAGGRVIGLGRGRLGSAAAAGQQRQSHR